MTAETQNKWRKDRPPRRIPVEVEWQGGVIRVVAIYQPDQEQPAWRTLDGRRVWSSGFFERWRYARVKN